MSGNAEFSDTPSLKLLAFLLRSACSFPVKDGGNPPALCASYRKSNF